IHGVTVLQPADRVETHRAVEWMLKHQGPVYLRLTRQDVPEVHKPDYKFQPGKIDVLHTTPGKSHYQAVVFASAGTVGAALEAVKQLEPGGFAIKAVNVHTIKPLDEMGVVEAAADADRIVSVEDHHQHGGLGSAVAEALASAGAGKPLVILGVKD